MSVVACVTQKIFIKQLLYKQMILEEMEQNMLQKHTNVNINRSEEGDDFRLKKRNPPFMERNQLQERFLKSISIPSLFFDGSSELSMSCTWVLMSWQTYLQQ